MAERHGISRAEFARLKSLNHKIRATLTSVEADYYRKLTGMANNLNQLALSANRGELLTSKILESLKGINTTIEKLQ